MNLENVHVLNIHMCIFKENQHDVANKFITAMNNLISDLKSLYFLGLTPKLLELKKKLFLFHILLFRKSAEKFIVCSEVIS